MSEFLNTVDFSRIKMAQNHSENAFAIASRECIHNAIAYDATIAHIIPVSKDDKTYWMFGHNGTPFSSLEEMKIALQFNKGKGGGSQGSGMKAAAYTFFRNIGDIELIVASRTAEGDYAVKMSHKSNHNNSVSIEDVSDDWVTKLKKFFPGSYNDYNVIYLYRYASSKNVFNAENMQKIVQITPWMKYYSDKLKVRFYKTLKNPDDQTFNKSETSYNVNVIWDMIENYTLKTFTIPVKDVKTTFITDEINQLDVLVNADIKISILPNLIERNSSDSNKSGNTIISLKPEVFKNNNNYNISSNNITPFMGLSYQDYNLGGNNKRANIDPVYFTNPLSTSHLFRDLDIQMPNKKGKQPPIPKEIFDNYSLNPDSDYKWQPTFLLEVFIKDVKNIHRDLGSLDNFFCTGDKNVYRDVIKSILQKANEENSDILKQTREYCKKFVPEIDINSFPEVSLNVADRKAQIGVKLTSNGLKDAQNAINLGYLKWKKIPNSALIYTKTMPYNTVKIFGLECQLFNLETNPHTPITGEIEVYHPSGKDNGLKIVKVGDKDDGIYKISVSDLFYYDENGIKIEITEDEYKEIGSSAYPNKQYRIDTIYGRKNLDLTVEVPTIPNFYSDDVDHKNRKDKNMGTQTKETNSIYKSEPEYIIATYVSGKLYLNKDNQLIQKLAKGKTETPKLKNKFNEFYHLVQDWCIDNLNPNALNNEIKNFKCNDEMIEKWGDSKTWFLNKTIKTMCEGYKLPLELIDHYYKEVATKVDDGELYESLDEDDTVENIVV